MVKSWEEIKACFREKWLAAHGYWTVYFARAQLFLGIFLEVLVQADMSALIPDARVLAIWLIFAGIVTEYLRKRRREREG